MKTTLSIILAGFLVFCGFLVLESGLFNTAPAANPGCILLQKNASITETPESKTPAAGTLRLQSADPDLLRAEFTAEQSEAKKIKLGSTNSESGFKFLIELNSRGAAIERAVFSEFKNRDEKNPGPLEFLTPAGKNLSLANRELFLINQAQKIRLNKLHWQGFGPQKASDGTQRARFEAIIKHKGTGQPLMKLTKTYSIKPESYDINCSLLVENLSKDKQKVRFNISGPLGVRRESFRGDMRKVAGGFRSVEGKIISTVKDLQVGPPMSWFTDKKGLEENTQAYSSALADGNDSRIKKIKQNLRIGRNLSDSQQFAQFIWAAISNKYFTAIMRPVPDRPEKPCEWLADTLAYYYNPDGKKDADNPDETIGIILETKENSLAAAPQPESEKKYNFHLYVGPKDKSIFDQNELYKSLGFYHTINFRTCCCCPATIIKPLAFGILWLMKWMHGFIGNYGIVIIILVFLLRLCIHPLTKKSQVSMTKFSKLAPKMEEIKKKYANNKTEMNKQVMALYREHGASPITGMLPMFVQMPIWFALYTAIFTSIDLRGAGFLPFWITDLSVPDALFAFPGGIEVPVLGTTFNLLPILMGLAFYFQQKLMPSKAAANPQAAQQQKMMMAMMPIIFPLILYKAPSGLNLYIMASVSAGAIEQYIIRKHIREKEEAESQGLVSVTSKTGGKVKKKKPKPFFKDH